MSRFAFLIALLGFNAIGATIIPFVREEPRVNQYVYITSNNSTSLYFTSHFGADNNNSLYWRGFGLKNVGPNEIVTTEPSGLDYPMRQFSFQSDDRARRDTFLWVTDSIGSSRISDYFESILFFLPREGQMHVEEMENEIHVTLTTGEEVVFSKKHRTILAGALKEKSLDMNPDRNQRKHAQLFYSGKGIVLRSDSRGADPRLGTIVQVLKPGLAPCLMKAQNFWTQEGFPKFKHVTDEEAYNVIRDICGSQYLPGN